jgi:DNA-binding NarL/FixJ family response regulator
MDHEPVGTHTTRDTSSSPQLVLDDLRLLPEGLPRAREAQWWLDYYSRHFRSTASELSALRDREVHRMLDAGESQRAVAEQLGVSHGLVGIIALRRES